MPRLDLEKDKTTTTTATPNDDNNDDNDNKAVAFVRKVGYNAEIARGVVQALRDNGGKTSEDALLAMVQSLAGRWEVGEDAGLEALAASVQQEIKAQNNTRLVTIHVVPGSAWDTTNEQDEHDTLHDNYHQVPSWKDAPESIRQRAFTVQGYAGMTLREVAQFGTTEGADVLGEYLECACSGIMACSTCHVVVDPEWYNNNNNNSKDNHKIEPPSDDEQDMIDLAYHPRRTSRLGCQLVLQPELDGLILWLPKQHYNLMDHIPFEG